MNDYDQPLDQACLDTLSHRPLHRPERFAKATCADCGTPLSSYNPNTICEACRQRRRRQVLPANRPIRIELYRNDYLLKLGEREPVLP